MRGTDAPARRIRIVAAAVAVAVVGILAPARAGGGSPGAGSAAKVDPSLSVRAGRHPHARLPVIVRETRPAHHDAEALVRRLGGTVSHELPIIGSFSAVVPGDAVGSLAASGDVLRVWGDAHIAPSSVDMRQYDTYQPNTVWRDALRLPSLPGYDGTGVTVALLDTGIVQSPDFGNRVLARVDFTPDRDGWDRYGHGTHMAGIIAGDGSASGGQYKGVAPGANLVSVKVAGADGSTDVSVVIAGMQWIVAHKAQYGIRVMNLSFGTDSQQSYSLDPLDYAVEQVWFSGIVVVVAAGNRGPDAGTINKPGDDPFVITVGAATLANSDVRDDDRTAAFSSRGPTQDGFAKPDLIAPGVSVVSVRDPGSTIDQQHPDARVGDAYFKGTGTSQAAAMISGLVARLLQRTPSLSPDEVKWVLTAGAFTGLLSQVGAGSGLADLGQSASLITSWWRQRANVGIARSTGLGSLDASRGSMHVYTDLPGDGLGAADADGTLDLLTGEIDYLGNPWVGTSWWSTGWTAAGWAATGWSATGWSATGWSATGWSATGWSGTSWTATGWSATGWSATGWSATGWSGDSWS